MAEETPARYCSNCGHELSPEDQFCPNCGRPVHQTATVPTPEADVPVPPPPPQAGAAAPPPPQAEGSQRSWPRRHPLLTGCLGLVGVFVILIVAIVAAATGGGGGGGGGGGKVAEKPKLEHKAAQSEKKAQPQKKEQAQGGGEKQQAAQEASPHFGDGTHQVGTDIQPGTYRTREGSPMCYYARLSGFSGETKDILANGTTGAPAVVTIKPTDAGFESDGCGTWTQDLSAITSSKTSFGAGIYIVGTDIEPGTYRDSGGSNCYYARLHDFTGSTSSIIANNVASAPTVITIKPTDAGFDSSGCGTWKKLE